METFQLTLTEDFLLIYPILNNPAKICKLKDYFIKKYYYEYTFKVFREQTFRK